MTCLARYTLSFVHFVTARYALGLVTLGLRLWSVVGMLKTIFYQNQ